MKRTGYQADAQSLRHHDIEVTIMRNIGVYDRVARIMVGAVLIAATVTGMVGVWGWIGIVPLATGLVGWCPAYQLFGLNTRAASDKHA